MGSFDAFVAKWDKRGNFKWVKLLGTNVADDALSVAIARSGDVYVGGWTMGNIDGGSQNTTGKDGFLAKLDKNGNQKWIKQLHSTAPDTADDEVDGVAVSSTPEIYIAGTTTGEFPGETDTQSYQPFIAKFDKNGVQKFFDQPDPVSHPLQVSGIALTSTKELWLAGTSDTAGDEDAVIGKWDKNLANPTFISLDSGDDEQGLGLAVASTGDAYLTGYTTGEFPGQPSSGNLDAYITKIDTTVNQVWIRQLDSGGLDDGAGAAVLPSKSVVVVGNTDGSLWGHANAGGNDMWLSVFPPS